eukprot:TRINITY_DN693_c0_g1_i1.p1 TRINITY_DN693_c0_g1~~TRINITY_DN693_c0_g1_i1.p1  ORF type:complete len:208 (-),score=23.46 TRINITY_DN693_c0_g1_i1:187-789(-)
MATTKRTVKLVIVGDGAVGKTCVLMSYANKKFPSAYVPTVFDNYVVSLTAGHSKLGNVQVELSLWDTAGQEEYDRLRPLSYSNANVFLVCFSLLSPTSYENISAKWYPELYHFCPEVPIVLIGTKMDLKRDEQALADLQKQGYRSPISFEQGWDLAKKIGAVKYLECSAKTTENLKEVFDEAVKAVLFKSTKKQKKCLIL